MINEPENDDVKYIRLHTPEGKPLRLRRAFIMSMLGHTNERQNTIIKVDNQNHNGIYTAKENVDEIPGSFAAVGNLRINPAYVSAVFPNEDESAQTHPYSVEMRAPEKLAYNIHISEEEFFKEMERARSEGPC